MRCGCSGSASPPTCGSPIACRSSPRCAARTATRVKPYALYVRVRPWRDRPIDIQAGRIPPTFGAFARRDYGAGNPLIGYPLAYQYLTSVRPDALPASTDDVLRMRARGWRPSYPIGRSTIAPGMPLITAFRWDTGVQVRIGPETLNASVAVTNGTVSDPRTRDNNGGKQIAGRMHWQPAPAFALGGSAARGRVCRRRGAGERDDRWPARRARRNRRSAPTPNIRAITGSCGASSSGTAGRFRRSRTTLDAPSVFVEGSYKISPGFFVAAPPRSAQLQQSDVVARHARRGMRRSPGSKRASASTSAATC